MIWFIMACFALFFWKIADDHLKEKFNPYLKYGVLLGCMLVILFEVYFFIEFERFMYAREIGGDTGLKYSNTTLEKTMYDINDRDTREIFVYHLSEIQTMQFLGIFLNLLPIFIAMAFAIQILELYYFRYLGKYD